jgi:hypothetical protein
MRRPNWKNKLDACCRCGKLLPTPKDHELPDVAKELHVWDPEGGALSQWVCPECFDVLNEDQRRDA